MASPIRSSGIDWGRAVRDLSGLAGIGLTAYGMWLWWEPAGFVAGGALLFGLSALASVRAR